MMHSDSRVKEPVCLATTSLPDPCLSTYLSPRFREEPKKMAAGPAVNKTASAVPAHNSPEITHPQAVVPIPAVTTKRIVCSADDRAAQLCQ